MKSYEIGFNKLGIDLSKVNSTNLTTCPQCSHERKQGHRNSKVLSVNKDTGHYTCHHCDFKGRVDSDEWINDKHDKETGLKKVTGYNQLQPVTKTKNILQMKPFHTTALTPNAIQFLNDRGISEATAKACKVAFHKDALCFNYYKGNKIIGAKYRLITKKFFWQHAGCEKYLYNLESLLDQDTIMLVEGEFDVLAIIESGFLQVGSVSQGAPNAGSEVGTKLQCLNNSIDYIKNAKRVLIWTDGDANGRYLEKVLIERFGADRCAIVEVPKELIDSSTDETCKDANAVLINYGPEKVKELIDNAKDTPIAGVRTLGQAKAKMMDIYANGYRKGVETGIRELKGAFSFYKMWWYLWHGIPNSGKSAFVNFLMMCMSVQHGWKWAVFSPEHYPEEDFYIDMIEILTGRNVEPKNPNRLTPEEFEVAMEFVGEHFFFVYPQVDNMANSSENVLNKIRELKLSKGIDGFLIDPYNQLTRGAENIDVYLERSLNDVDNLCNTHNLVGNIVAHPRTLYKEKGEEDYKKSTPYQVAGGAMWYNKAYGITSVHRPHNQSNKIDTTVEIDIQKIKSHKRAGRPKAVDMNYDIKTGWYMSLMNECPLTGEFEKLKAKAGIKHEIEKEQTESTFTEKMNGANLSPAGYDLDQCPF